MKHFVLFFTTTGPRATCAATFPTRKAAEDFAREWKLTAYAVGEVQNIIRFPAGIKTLRARKVAKKLLAAPKSI